MTSLLEIDHAHTVTQKTFESWKAAIHKFKGSKGYTKTVLDQVTLDYLYQAIPLFLVDCMSQLSIDLAQYIESFDTTSERKFITRPLADLVLSGAVTHYQKQKIAAYDIVTVDTAVHKDMMKLIVQQLLLDCLRRAPSISAETLFVNGALQEKVWLKIKNLAAEQNRSFLLHDDEITFKQVYHAIGSVVLSVNSDTDNVSSYDQPLILLEYLMTVEHARAQISV